MPENSSRPFLGFGLGLRTDYYQQIVNEKPAVDWFEILSENFGAEIEHDSCSLYTRGEHLRLYAVSDIALRARKTWFSDDAEHSTTSLW